MFNNIENGQLGIGSRKIQYHDQYNIGHDIGRYWSILVSKTDHDIHQDIGQY